MRHNQLAPGADGLGAIRDTLAGIVRRLDELEKPAGTNKTNLTSQVETQLASIDTRVSNSIAANSYTKAQIDSKVASPGAITPTTVSASGDVTTTTALRGADVYATSAPGYNITGTRVAGWWESATGRGGTASSSERFKTNIADAGLATEARAQAILGCLVVHYNYTAELAKRDDPTSPDYVGSGYHVHTEVGMIAERLHEAGLWEFVIYERVTDTETRYRDVTAEDGTVTQEAYEVILGDTLKLDAAGNPIPFGIHYELFGLAALAAAQYAYGKYTDLEARVATLEGTK